MTKCTFQNFKDFLGKEVYVEICCYSGGMIHPDRNVLIGMNKGTYYFQSIEEHQDEPHYWHWQFNDGSTDDSDCSCDVFLYSTYQENMEKFREEYESKQEQRKLEVEVQPITNKPTTFLQRFCNLLLKMK